MVPFIFIGFEISFLDSPRWVMPAVDVLFVVGVVAILAELIVVYAFFYPKRPRVFYGYLFAGILATYGIVFRFELVVLFLLFLLLVDFELIRVVMLALCRRKRWSWIVAVGVVPGIIIQFWDQFEKAGLVTAPWTGTTFSPGVGRDVGLRSRGRSIR